MNNRFFIRNFQVSKSYKKDKTFWDIVLFRKEVPMFHYDVRFEFSGQVMKPGYQFIIEGGTKFMIKSIERLVTVNKDVNFAEAITIFRTPDDLHKMEKPEYGIVTSKTGE